MGSIYKITNKVNGKVYIGQTIYPKDRFNQHISDSYKKERDSYNSHFHQAIRKYGPENFIYEIIENVNDSELNERETYWIEYYDSFNNGYNSTLGGGGNRKYKPQDIINAWEKGYTYKQIKQLLGCSKNVIAVTLKNAGFSFEERLEVGQIKPIYQYDLEGNFIAKWKSTKEVVNHFNINIDALYSVLSGRTKTCNGYIFRWFYYDKIYPPTQLLGKPPAESKILDFIKRRFPNDNNFLCQNCYWFSAILHHRFPRSEIWYDSIEGHFLCKIGNKYYDWTGEVKPKNELIQLWKIQAKDPVWFDRLKRDCID